MMLQAIMLVSSMNCLGRSILISRCMSLIDNVCSASFRCYCHRGCLDGVGSVDLRCLVSSLLEPSEAIVMHTPRKQVCGSLVHVDVLFALVGIHVVFMSMCLSTHDRCLPWLRVCVELC
jgi:hypothetical protein